MGKRRGGHWVSVGRHEGKRSLERPRRGWQDIIKMDLQELGWAGMDCIDLIQDRGRWRSLVNAVSSLRVSKNTGNFLTIWGPVSDSRRSLFNGVSYYVVPWLRRLVTDLLPRRRGFNPRPYYVGFVVDKATSGQVFFSEYFGLHLSVSFYQCFTLVFIQLS